MKTKVSKILAAAVALVLTASISIAGIQAAYKSKIPDSKTYEFSTEGLTGDKTTELMSANPDRGLRMEVYLDVATGMSLFEYADVDAFQQLQDEIDKYKSDNPTLVQVYFYLTGYKDKELDQTAFDNMNRYFDMLEENNLKAVLRFAYISDDTNPLSQEPEDDMVVRHWEQLSSFITERRDQISVLQAGCVGAWGEWDSGAMSRVDYKKILDAIMDNTPDDLYVQVRYSYIKTDNFSKDDPDYDRIGFHDDFLIGNLHGWNTAGSDPQSDRYQQMSEESCYVPVDGEMIWGSANDYYKGEIGGDYISSIKMAKRMAEHHFTSLSLTHNYKEKDGYYSMEYWKTEYINQNILDENGLLYDESWFLDENVNNLPRTMFDYIKDYLGYYLKAEKASAVVNGDTVTATVALKNYGFAAPLTLDKIELVLLDADGNPVSSSEFCSLEELQSGSTVEKTIELQRPENGRGYRLALRLSSRNGDTARLANNIEYTDGYNILGDLI